MMIPPPDPSRVGAGIRIEGEGEWNACRHGASGRRVRRRIRSGIGESAERQETEAPFRRRTPEIRAAAFTTGDTGDAPVPPGPPDRIPPGQQIATVTADGALGTGKCHGATASRGAAASILPRRNARPRRPDGAAALARDKARRASGRFGRTFRRRWSGQQRPSRVEPWMHSVKGPGQRPTG